MASFDESKHPRDKDGKFASKGDSKEYRQNTSYNEILKVNEDKPVIINESGKTLTRQELAIWSSELAREKYGGYIKTLPDGTKVIRAKKKAVFTKGTFEKPIITRIYEFESDIEISLFMEFL